MSPNTRRFILPLVYLAIALVAYGPALRGELILDDWGYITRNPWVTTSASPWVFWSRLDQIDYYPLTYTWYWVAWRLFGEATLPYHLVNVVLHTGVATLVASICRRLIAPAPFWVSALAGLGFLLHPQNVPAVAWIIQSKTILATFLALAATLLYLRRREIPAVLAFAAALAAKASVASLPLWLFIVARKERRRLLPIVGFFAVAIASAGLATYVNRNSVSRVPPLSDRLIELPLNLVFYLRGFVASCFRHTRASSTRCGLWILESPRARCLRQCQWQFLCGATCAARGSGQLAWRWRGTLSPFYLPSALFLASTCGLRR